MLETLFSYKMFKELCSAAERDWDSPLKRNVCKCQMILVMICMWACVHSGPVVDGVCGVFEVMATGSSRSDCSNNVRELHAVGKTTPTGTGSDVFSSDAECVSCLYVAVSCAKLKRKKNWFGTAIYVEVTSEGESKKTAKSHSSSNPKWDERLTLWVTRVKLWYEVPLTAYTSLTSYSSGFSLRLVITF